MPNDPIDPVQFYKTWVQIGSFLIPVLAGASLPVDENFLTPMPIGNYWQYNYAPGPIQPVLEVPLLVRDTADDECLSLAFLDYFTDRTDDDAHTTTEIPGGCILYDGGDCQQLTGAKADSFTINCQKGEIVSMTARFCGTDVVPAATPSRPAWSADPPMTYTSVNFDTDSFKDAAYNFGASYSNNHWPDMAMNGERGPAAWNAGSKSSGFNVRVQAKKDLPDDDSTIILTLTGENVTRIFTLPRVQCRNRRTRGLQPPQSMRNYTFQCTGGDGQTIAPLVIS